MFACGGVVSLALLRGHLAGESRKERARGIYTGDDIKRLLHALGDHVHAHGVTGGALEPEEERPTRDTGFDLDDTHMTQCEWHGESPSVVLLKGTELRRAKREVELKADARR